MYTVTGTTPYKELLPVMTYGYDGLFDTLYLLAIFWNGFMTYVAARAGKEHFYQFGHHATQALTRIFILGDKLASSKFLVPSKPWARYLKP